MNSHQQSENKSRLFWSPSRIALTLVVLCLLAVGGLSSCTSSDEKTDRTTNPNTDRTANQPPVISRANPPATAPTTTLPASILGERLQTVGGKTISLGEFSGKVMLVNLWATWCGPCRNEIPELVKLHHEFKARGLEVVGLSTEDPVRSAESVKNFVQAFKMDYQVGWATQNLEITLMQITQRDAIPQSFLISRDGRILKQFVGFSPVATPPQIRQAIEEALNG